MRRRINVTGEWHQRVRCTLPGVVAMEIRGISDMSQSEKIDSRPFYEAGFSGLPLKSQKTVLTVQDQLFSTTRGLFHPHLKGELMIVDCNQYDRDLL